MVLGCARSFMPFMYVRVALSLISIVVVGR